MDIKRYEPSDRFCKVVEHGDTLYVCGMTAPGATAAEQAKEIFRRIDELLEKYGSSKRHLLSATVYLSDFSVKPEFDIEWRAWVDKEALPIRACVGAVLEPADIVEVVVIAAKA